MKSPISEKRKKRIFDIIQIGQENDITSRVFDFFIVVTILANIAVLFLETFEGTGKYSKVLHGIELVTVIIFTMEYLLRLPCYGSTGF